jgi:hypothetical protein
VDTAELVGLERERLFLPLVVRHSGFRPDDQHQPRAATASWISW